MAAAVISHWHQRFPETQLSAMDFYEALFQAVKAKQLPGVTLSRVTYSEAGVLSSKREYFRIQRNEFIFDICAAPFGTNFFISYWLSEVTGCFIAIVSSIPIIGPAWAKRLLRKTFYQQDTEIMFKETIETILREVVNAIAEQGKGLRTLAEQEFKPQINTVY